MKGYFGHVKKSDQERNIFLGWPFVNYFTFDWPKGNDNPKFIEQTCNSESIYMAYEKEIIIS